MGYSNIIGFKIDSRLLLDHEDYEIDLGCLEAAINAFEADKVNHDKAKLAREAKDIVIDMKTIENDSSVNSQRKRRATKRLMMKGG